MSRVTPLYGNNRLGASYLQEGFKEGFKEVVTGARREFRQKPGFRTTRRAPAGTGVIQEIIGRGPSFVHSYESSALLDHSWMVLDAFQSNMVLNIV